MKNQAHNGDNLELTPEQLIGKLFLGIHTLDVVLFKRYNPRKPPKEPEDGEKLPIEFERTRDSMFEERATLIHALALMFSRPAKATSQPTNKLPLKRLPYYISKGKMFFVLTEKDPLTPDLMDICIGKKLRKGKTKSDPFVSKVIRVADEIKRRQIERKRNREQTTKIEN